MLAGPDLLVVPIVSRYGPQNYLLHDVPWHQGQIDRSVVPWMLLLTLLDHMVTTFLTSNQLGHSWSARTSGK